MNENPLNNKNWIYGIVVLPLAVMLCLFALDYSMFASVMTIRQKVPFFTVQGIALSAIAAALAYAEYLRRGRKIISANAGLVLSTVLTAAFLFSFFRSEAMRPPVPGFMLPVQRWPIWIATFYMPGIFFGLLLKAFHIQMKSAIWLSIAGMIAIPGLMYVMVHLYINPKFFFFASVIAVLSMTFYLFFLRVVAEGCLYLYSRRFGRSAMILIAALAFPFAGMLLNRMIPFPAPLQDGRVYLLIAVNAGILFLPDCGNRKIMSAVLFLRGTTYPFTLYFFLLFLPWLPLFVPALLACGAGFLILAPTLLFILQTYLLWKSLNNGTGKMGIAAFSIGLLLLPTLFVLTAYSDKSRLEHAVETYYNAPYRMSMAEQWKFPLKKVSASLTGYYEMKHGAELPFFGPIYQKIAYGGLLLSDAKLNRMYYDLNGKGIQGNFMFFQRNPGKSFRNPNALSGLKERKSTGDVYKDEVKAEGNNLILILKKKHNFDGEYVGILQLPEGVFVSGASLVIDGKTVPARIFERKSAFWMYENLTKIQKDPLLLAYEGENRLRLHVFPVHSRAPRKVTITLEYPRGTSPEIRVDEKTVRMGQKGTGNVRFYSKTVLARLPEAKAEPELVFVIDRSRNWTREELAGIIRRAEKDVNAKTFRIFSGILAAASSGNAYSFAETTRAIADFIREFRPGTPGFSAQRILKGSIAAQKTEPGKYPVFVLVSQSEPDRLWNCSDFAALLPHAPYVVLDNNKGPVRYYDLLQNRIVNKKPDGQKVVLLPDGRRTAVGNGTFSSFHGEKTYEDFQALLHASRELILHPEKEKMCFRELVEKSKKTGCLIPQTAYLALENDAQWKFLEKKEKDKLSGNSAFDLAEIQADEPHLFLFVFLAAAGILLLSGKRIRKKTS